MTHLTAEEIRAMRGTSLRAGATLFWQLADEIAAEYGITPMDMTRKNRGALLVNEARQMLCMAALDRGLSSAAVGKFLGRDHSTVLYAAAAARGKIAKANEAG